MFLTAECGICGTVINTNVDEAFTVEDFAVCEACMETHYAECDACGEMRPKEALRRFKESHEKGSDGFDVLLLCAKCR